MASLSQEAWNIGDLGWRIHFNSQYNSNWIHCNHLSESVKSIEELSSEGLDVSDAHPHEVGWLKNIDRLIDMLPLSFDPSDYDMIDVGCGSGISTLYFVDNYPFNSFAGIDLSPSLIDIASDNLRLFNSRKNASHEIIFKVSDARKFILDDSKRNIFVYMFNPFGFDTAKLFLGNNLKILKRRNAILALSWDTWIWQLLAEKCHKAVIRNNFYKLSLVAF
jgi:SAM-dependent methyltransferase